MCINKFKIAIVMILFIFIINVSMPVQASMIDEIWSTGKDFIEMGKKGGGTFDGQKMQIAVNDLYNLFLMAGIVIAVIVGAFLGIKFMTEGIEGKAKIKEALIPFCIGCIVIFGGFAIWKIAMGLFKDVEEIQKSSISQQQYLESNCAEGNHTFDNYADKDCNNANCNKTCTHKMGSYDSSGNMSCQYRCGFDTVYCGSGYNGRKPENCNFANGACTKCGYVCSHKWAITDQTHTCSICGYTQKHSIVGNICSFCGHECTHQWVNDSANAQVQCSKCKKIVKWCTVATQAGGQGKSAHEDYNKDGQCDNCYCPMP